MSWINNQAPVSKAGRQQSDANRSKKLAAAITSNAKASTVGKRHATIAKFMRTMTVLAAVVAIGASACGSTTSESNAAAATPAPAAGTEVTGVVPRNAIVTLVPIPDAPLPDQPALLDQYAKQFVPSTLYVRVGQPVEFKNSEDMPHNVTVLRRGSGAEVFNISTEPQQKYLHTFDRAGQFDVTCDIHPGMQATLIAAPGDLATIADDAGRFSFANVKPGSYKLSLNFEGRTVEQPLDVKDARTEVRVNQ